MMYNRGIATTEAIAPARREIELCMDCQCWADRQCFSFHDLTSGIGRGVAPVMLLV